MQSLEYYLMILALSLNFSALIIASYYLDTTHTLYIIIIAVSVGLMQYVCVCVCVRRLLGMRVANVCVHVCVCACVGCWV